MVGVGGDGGGAAAPIRQLGNAGIVEGIVANEGKLDGNEEFLDGRTIAECL